MRPALRAAPSLAGSSTLVPDAGVEIAAGPPVARAANDVGGLLDTSKGWTLDIPDPRETEVASRAIINQQFSAQANAPSGTSGPAPAIASR